MAKRQRKEIKYSEGDMITLFGLTRLIGNDEHPLMTELTDTKELKLNQFEQYIFDKMLKNAKKGIEGWNEEELKMKFISYIVGLGNLEDGEKYRTYYERELYATVNDHYLYLKADFMIAKGVLDKPNIPYFYFQEYKKSKDPSGDPVPQLLEGFFDCARKK